VDEAATSIFHTSDAAGDPIDELIAAAKSELTQTNETRATVIEVKTKNFQDEQRILAEKIELTKEYFRIKRECAQGNTGNIFL
jgi:hypothetical protein